MEELRALTNEDFDALVERAKGALGNTRPTAHQSASAAALDQDTRDDARLQTLLGLLLAANLDATAPDALAADLLDSFEPKRADALAALYAETQQFAHNLLCALSPPMAHIVDVSWSRSTVVSSKWRPGAQSSLYEVSITTEEGGTTRRISFTANTEQLSCLVMELKSAIKAAELHSESLKPA
jgi:hypothetical protein